MEGFELFPKIKGAIKWMAEHSDCSGSQKARMRSKKDATPCCVAF